MQAYIPRFALLRQIQIIKTIISSKWIFTKYYILNKLQNKLHGLVFKDDLTTLYIVWTLVKTSTNTDHVRTTRQPFKTFNQQAQTLNIDEFQINEINVDLRTSGFDNEVLSVDACAVWWERESFYCLPHIGVVTWHREPLFQCGSARTGSIWNSSIDQCKSLISVGSQPFAGPFAQVLLCFSSGALLLKNIGNNDDPNCWMGNTIPRERIGLFDRRCGAGGSNSECHACKFHQSNGKDLYVSYFNTHRLHGTW